MSHEPSPDLTSAQDFDQASALFAQLVVQQFNMAMMFMGKVAHPESGKTVKDLETARLFIDTLEMLESRTRGNLSKEEANLLKQSLMNVRMQYVHAAEEPTSAAPSAETAAQPDAAAPPALEHSAQPSGKSAEEQATPTAEDEHRKKFTKKY